MMKKIEIEMSQDGTGRTCSELIRDVLTEMRKATPMPQARPRYPRHIAEDNVIQFPQQVVNSKNKVGLNTDFYLFKKLYIKR